MAWARSRLRPRSHCHRRRRRPCCHRGGRRTLGQHRARQRQASTGWDVSFLPLLQVCTALPGRSRVAIQPTVPARRDHAAPARCSNQFQQRARFARSVCSGKQNPAACGIRQISHARRSGERSRVLRTPVDITIDGARSPCKAFPLAGRADRRASRVDRGTVPPPARHRAVASAAAQAAGELTCPAPRPSSALPLSCKRKPRISAGFSSATMPPCRLYGGCVDQRATGAAVSARSICRPLAVVPVARITQLTALPTPAGVSRRFTAALPSTGSSPT